MSKSDKKPLYEEDDGQTIAPMDALYDKKPHSPSRNRKVKENFKEIGFTKKETRAMIRGAYAALLPAFLIFSACMGLVLLLIYLFW